MIHILLLPQKRWDGKLSRNLKGVQWLYSSPYLLCVKKFLFPFKLSQNLEMTIMKIARVVVWGSSRLSTAAH
tara:strand:+ start:492 stop:707 length:216 start_codon:yes stop_codon:yes gene_type:complete